MSNNLKPYTVTLSMIHLEAIDEDDARQQALSMIEEGSWSMRVIEGACPLEFDIYAAKADGA